MLKSTINKFLLAAVILVSAGCFIKYGKNSNTLYGDALGYYMYLPATFIYNNVDRMYDLPDDKTIHFGIRWYAQEMKARKGPIGKEVNQYTYGIAFLEMPFFFIAHAIEKVRGHTGNGYSITYQYLVKASSVFYLLMGMLLLYRILKNYFPPGISLLTLLCLFIGTNLFWFTLLQSGMSHIPLFFLYCMLILSTIELHKKPQKRKFIAMGLTIGLITVIRPTDILCILIPLLYNVYNKVTMHDKILLLKNHASKMALLIAAFILPVIPQLLYWKTTTGQYIYYSYADQSFSYWKHPKIIEGLFSFNNGWLAYSPIMLISLAGMVLYRRYKKWAWCLWVILPAYIYIIYSWYCYNYINGLGSRPMIHLYPLLAIPFAALLQVVAMQKNITKAAFITLCLFFTGINIGFSRMRSAGILQSEESNLAYNARMFFKDHIEYQDLYVRDIGENPPVPSEIKGHIADSCSSFNDSLSAAFYSDTRIGKGYVFKVGNEDFSPNVSITYNKKTMQGTRWIKCSGFFMYPQSAGYPFHLLVLDISGKLWKGCRIENKIDSTLSAYPLDYSQPNKWGHISYFVRMPANIKDGDIIKLFVWNMPKTDLYMDDLCLELCN